MIIIWDCKTGRREFTEMMLKSEKIECFAAREYSNDTLSEIKSLEPDCIICSRELMHQIKDSQWNCPILTLGEDLDLPIEPLVLLKKIKEITF